MPVWLTEFNGWSGTERDNYDFLKQALRFWSATKPSSATPTSSPAKARRTAFSARKKTVSRAWGSSIAMRAPE